MELIVTQEQLLPALQNLSRFVAAKAQLPILNNILFEADTDQLKLTATNLELTLQHQLPANVLIPGKITIPSKEITEFISYLSPGKITLKLTDTGLIELNTQHTSATFTILAATDFPVLPTLEQSQSFLLPAVEFIKLVDQVSYAAASDDSRPILTGVLTKVDQETISLVATDGFRLSQVFKTLKNPIINLSSSVLFLIPAKALLEVSKLTKNQTEIRFFANTNQNQATFLLSDGTMLSTRLLQGDYPDYERIIPTNTTTKIILDKEEFLQGIKTASVFARQSANVIRLKIGTGSLILSANAPQVGKQQTEVEAKIEGKPIEIAFNYKFILDFLTNISSSSFQIEVNEPLTPARFRDPSESSNVHIIMPVRLQD